jgi:hypothetical protein
MTKGNVQISKMHGTKGDYIKGDNPDNADQKQQ